MRNCDRKTLSIFATAQDSDVSSKSNLTRAVGRYVHSYSQAVVCFLFQRIVKWFFLGIESNVSEKTLFLLKSQIPNMKLFSRIAKGEEILKMISAECK